MKQKDETRDVEFTKLDLLLDEKEATGTNKTTGKQEDGKRGEKYAKHAGEDKESQEKQEPQKIADDVYIEALRKVTLEEANSDTTRSLEVLE